MAKKEVTTRITTGQIKELLTQDIEQLANEMAKAINNARDGSIIDDSEMPVFEANGKFRQKAFEKVLDLVQKKHEAFSPSGQKTSKSRKKKGHTPDN